MSARHQPRWSARPLIATLAALTLAATGGAFFAAEAATSQTELVSVSSSGVQGNRASGNDKAVSADGRYVVFVSRASNLVPNDTNQALDVFVRDRLTQRTERVSVGNGHQANGRSFNPDITDDGRYVVFSSVASNLVRHDTNRTEDVFVRDRRLDRTSRVSVSGHGAQGNSFSFDGDISANGLFVAFESGASNLVPGDTNDSTDIFLRDRRRGTTRRVSVSSKGAQAFRNSWGSREPALSATGRFIAFSSGASNLVRGDNNHATLHGIDIFVRDRRAHTTRLVSVQTNGRQFFDSVDPDISRNGRFVVFEEGDICCNEMRIRLRDRGAGTTRLISLPQTTFDSNLRPSVSADGRYVVYTSDTPLPGEDPQDGSYDVLLADVRLGTTSYAALSSTGTKVSPDFDSVVSDDGRWVVFGSDSGTVVPGDTNRIGDVFIHRR